MALIHRRQQADILLGVFLGKARHGPLAALQPARLAVLGNQSGELLTGIAADLYQVTDHHPFSLAGAFQVPEFDQFSLNPAVSRRPWSLMTEKATAWVPDRKSSS